jgi:hypothetical protein
VAQLTAALQQRDERITALDARFQARQYTTSDYITGCSVACSAVRKQWQDSVQCTAATFTCVESRVWCETLASTVGCRTCWRGA